MSKNTNARLIAVKALCRVNVNDAYSNITLNSILKEYELSSADIALCTTIFYGTLERKITIDYIISQFIMTGLNRLKPMTLNVLRSAVYQLKYMSKIPESAVVNEAVKIIKNSKESFASGFVNGVLRNIIRSEVKIPDSDSISDLSIKYSCPEWIINSLVNDYSVNVAKSFLESTLDIQKTYIRVNTLKCDVNTLKNLLLNDGIKVNDTELENTLEISDYSSLESIESFKNGLFYVQDIACQKAISMLQINDNDRIFDMCAAPGGKTFTASLSANNVSVLSADLYEQRAGLITKTANRLGLNNIEVKTLDATKYYDDLGLFNKIICDVPCSGLGVIGKKPDIKYKKIDDFDNMAEIQLSILSNADKYLKDDGKILYSTCTLRKSENEGIVEAFLDTHDNYKIVSMKTFFPSSDRSDGFFATVLQKS